MLRWYCVIEVACTLTLDIIVVLKKQSNKYNCNFTVNRDHINKSKKTRVVGYVLTLSYSTVVLYIRFGDFGLKLSPQNQLGIYFLRV